MRHGPRISVRLPGRAPARVRRCLPKAASGRRGRGRFLYWKWYLWPWKSTRRVAKYSKMTVLPADAVARDSENRRSQQRRSDSANALIEASGQAGSRMRVEEARGGRVRPAAQGRTRHRSHGVEGWGGGGMHRLALAACVRKAAGARRIGAYAAGCARRDEPSDAALHSTAGRRNLMVDMTDTATASPESLRSVLLSLDASATLEYLACERGGRPSVAACRFGTWSCQTAR